MGGLGTQRSRFLSVRPSVLSNDLVVMVRNDVIAPGDPLQDRMVALDTALHQLEADSQPAADTARLKARSARVRAAADGLLTAAAEERAVRERAQDEQRFLARELRAAYGRSASLASQLDRAYVETITSLAQAVEARDRHTGEHVGRVQRYSAFIAERLGISGDARRQLEYGAILHDVGKIGIPDGVLAKRGPLTADDWRLMRMHPEIGLRVLRGIAFLDSFALAAVSAHHERWDGTGYPKGLAGRQIPLSGLIVAVADTYDAMTSARPYRPPLSHEQSLAELQRERGHQFAPEVVDAFSAYVPIPVDRAG